MTTWATALAAAKAGTGQARVAFVGDSILEGEGASTATNRCTAKTITGVRSKAGIAGSAPGMIGCYHDTQLSDSASWRNPLSASSGIVTNGWFSTQGWRGADYNATGYYAQWSVVCDSFDVVQMQGTGDGGSYTVTVDGGSPTVINSSSGSFSVSNVTHINIGGTAASHVIRVTLTAGAGAVDGIVPYVGDYSAGIQWWDATHFGFNSNDFGTSDALDSLAAIGNFAPHLIVDNIVGTADYSQNATTPSQMVSNLNARIAKYNAMASSPTMLFMATYQVNNQLTTPNSNGYTMQQYFDAAKTAVQSAGGLWLNLNDVYPNFATTSGWLASDNGHPSDTGHQKIADAIVAALVPDSSVTGTVAATSTASGAIQARRPVTGTTPVVSAASAATAARLSVSGSVAASSTVVGSVTRVQAAGGQVDAASTVAGTVTLIPAGGWAVSGTVTATTASAGSPQLLATVGGSVGAVTDASATVDVAAHGEYAVDGTISIVVGASGTVNGTLRIAGTINTVSIVQGAVTSSADHLRDITITVTPLADRWQVTPTPDRWRVQCLES